MATKTKKRTTKRKTKAIVPPGPSHPFDLNRFKNMVIVALIAIIIGISTAFFVTIFNVRGKVVTSNEQAYLRVFPELVNAFTRNLGSTMKTPEINSERQTSTKMTGYGVSETDGAFYIDLEFSYLDEIDQANPEATPIHKGTVYFWEDSEKPGQYSYAFSYEN